MPVEPSPSRRRLTLFDATCIMVGIVVGSGIFGIPSEVAKLSANSLVLLSVWICGGIASLLGALCYAELSTRYPEDGGGYAFLNRAYGPWAGFLFAWSDFWIVRPANIGAVAFVLGAYAQAAWPNRVGGSLGYALAAVAVTTGVHLCGIHIGRWSQNAMSVAKVVGLLLVVLAAAFASPVQAADHAASSGAVLGDWPRAWVLVMFCYGGWSDLSNVAAEVREPSRNLLRALVLGIATITALYLAVNGAALYALGLDGLAESHAMAVDVVQAPFTGPTATPAAALAGLVGILVAVSCLGSLSGVVFTGARVYFALGLRHKLFAWLAGWDARRNTPPQSLVAQAGISCALLLVAGQKEGGFDRLVIFNAPCYWGFTMLVTLAVIVLRLRDQTTPFPFRTPLFPLTPILFAAVCLALVIASISWVLRPENRGPEAWYSLAILIVGAVLTPVFTWARRSGPA